ncbi:MAG: hypothetical protein LM514_04405, partial [Streptococcus sp.]|nr:hypothetical protein [Streptococcus sp.]
DQCDLETDMTQKIFAPVYFKSPWCIDRLDADDEANEMHDTVVHEISTRLLRGETFEEDHE